MDQPERADVAIVAGFKPACVIVLAALDGDILDSFAERAVSDNVGRVGVGKDKRAVGGGGPETFDQFIG